MKKMLTLFKDSFYELSKVKTLTMTALFVALAVVLGLYSVQLTENIKISFAFLANELTSMLFGPVVGGIMGGIADILKYIVHPTGPFFPGFTLSAILGGVLYGVFFYKRPLTLPRVIFAKSFNCILLDLGLTTYWLHIMYGNPYLPVLVTRLVKELIMLPMEIALLYMVARFLQSSHVFHFVKE